MLVIAFGLILVFFYNFLPSYTNHGETITVPDLKGMSYSELDDFLSDRDLRFEIEADSGYSSEYPPLTVLKQYPTAGSTVKSNRKIFLNLNKTRPKKVRMPNLVDASFKSAYMVLESIGLAVGKIEYVPDLAQNAVLDQKFEGKAIEPGDSIYQGSQVDLVVGDGLGNQTLEVPDLRGMKFEDAKWAVQSSGLNIGSVLSVQSDTAQTGAVIRQIPLPGGSIRVGEDVDLWVVDYDEQAETSSSSSSEDLSN